MTETYHKLPNHQYDALKRSIKVSDRDSYLAAILIFFTGITGIDIVASIILLKV
jgi:hypothetical protein